jgi:hypothetical protein
MTFDSVRRILDRDDGSLPDITFEFGAARIADAAYRLIRARATTLNGRQDAYYWSRSRDEACPIDFASEPALAILAGDAEPFHVVFGGLRSSAGAPVPDLGVFVFTPGEIALDYRMGPEWNDPAILGLFEIMRDLARLATPVRITHTSNIFDPDGDILLGAYRTWLASQSASNAVP